MSVPSTSSFFSGEDSISALYARTGRRFAYTPSVLRIPSRPFSGRFSGGALSNSGSPTAPISVASASTASFAVSSGKRAAGLVNRNAAQQCFALVQLVIELAADVLQHSHGFTRDFRADAIARHNQYV